MSKLLAECLYKDLVMYKYFTFDTSIKEGDLVTSGYHRQGLLFRVVKITQRFISQSEIDKDKKYNGNYSDCEAGDETNPLVEIKPVFDLNDLQNKKLRTNVKHLDGSYLRKMTKERYAQHIESLREQAKQLEDARDVIFS